MSGTRRELVGPLRDMSAQMATSKDLPVERGDGDAIAASLHLLVGPGGELVDQRGESDQQVGGELLLGLRQRGVEGALATP